MKNQYEDLAKNFLLLMSPIIKEREIQFIFRPSGIQNQTDNLAITRHGTAFPGQQVFVARFWLEKRTEGAQFKFTDTEQWSEGYGCFMKLQGNPGAANNGYWYPAVTLAAIIACLSKSLLPEDIIKSAFKKSELVPNGNLPVDAVRTLFKKLSLSCKSEYMELLEIDPIVKSGFLLLQDRLKELPRKRITASFEKIRKEMEFIAREGVKITEEEIVALWREAVIKDVMES